MESCKFWFLAWPSLQFLVLPDLFRERIRSWRLVDCQTDFIDHVHFRKDEHVDVGPDQVAFINKARHIAIDFDVQFHYVSQNGFDEVHLGAIHHVIPSNVIKIAKAEDFDKLPSISPGSRQIILATTLDRHVSDSRIVILPHGHDEDPFWLSNISFDAEKRTSCLEFPPLSFTKYLQRHGYCNNLLSYLRPGLETVLYIASHRVWPFEGAGFTDLPLVATALNRLASDHNVIIREHPHDPVKMSCPSCIFGDTSLISIEHMVMNADVIVGEVSSVMIAALHTDVNKPRVYMLRDRDRYSCIKEHVMNDSMAEVIFPDRMSSSSDLIQAIARAKENNGPQQVEARRAYFKKYLGDIDGYEEYRVVVQLLRRLINDNQTMALEVDNLQRILARFSNVSYMGGVQLPTCDAACCAEWML